MTLRHIEIFIAVCEFGGITKAAKALHIAQPAVSRTISDLEKYYNVTLFDRINQRLVLTDTGKGLLLKAKELAAGFDEFEEAARDGGSNLRVRAGASLTLGQTIIPKFVKRTENNHPNIQLFVVIKPSAYIEEEIEKGNLDFALIEGEIQSPYIKAIPFQKDRLISIVNSDADIPDVMTAEELTHYPLILRERGSDSRESLEKVASALNLHIQPRIESVNNQAIISAVYASLGIAFLPESFVRGHIERGKFREIHIIDMDENRTNYIAVHKNKKMNTAQNQAFEILKTMCIL